MMLQEHSLKLFEASLFRVPGFRKVHFFLLPALPSADLLGIFLLSVVTLIGMQGGREVKLKGLSL